MERVRRPANGVVMTGLIVLFALACQGGGEVATERRLLQTEIDDCVVAELLALKTEDREALKSDSSGEASYWLYFHPAQSALCDVRDSGKLGAMLKGRGLDEVYDRTAVIAVALQQRLRGETSDAEAAVQFVLKHRFGASRKRP